MVRPPSRLLHLIISGGTATCSNSTAQSGRLQENLGERSPLVGGALASGLLVHWTSVNDDTTVSGVLTPPSLATTWRAIVQPPHDQRMDTCRTLSFYLNGNRFTGWKYSLALAGDEGGQRIVSN